MNIQHPSRKAVIASAAVAAMTVTGIAGTAVASSFRDVTLEVDGVSIPVSGFMGKVSDVLATAGVEVSSHDLVAPSLHERVSNGQTILVRRAQQYMVDIDGVSTPTWSTATDIDDLLGQVGTKGAVIAADRSTSRAELPALTASGPIRVVADGQTHTVDARQGASASDLLSQAGVEVSFLDRVVFTSDEQGSFLRVIRVQRGVEEREETLTKEVEEQEDSTLAKGTRKVAQEGSDGSIKRSVYVERRDGQEIVSQVVSENRTEPVKQIVKIGTKETTTASSSSAASSSSGSSATVTGNDVWAALARCESGGNPATNTGNGYYGLYQFSASTWRAMGGTGLPSEASAAEQTQRAQALQARSGWGQWPACARSLGLL